MIEGVLATLIFIAAGALGYVLGLCDEHSDMKEEAVKRGHAEYYLDENNERQWRWKEIGK